MKNRKDVLVEGILSVKAIYGSSYVSIATAEKEDVYLATKGSEVTKVYTVTGSTSVTVEPEFQATVMNKDGKQIGKSKIVKLELRRA